MAATPLAPLRIGELARRTGVSPDTLRHYERVGALRGARRSGSGQRCYDASAVDQVLAIRRGLRLGFSLRELADAFRTRAEGGVPCQRVRALAEQKLERLEALVAELTERRDLLRRTLVAWDQRLGAAPPGMRAGLLAALCFEPGAARRPDPSLLSTPNRKSRP